VKKVLFIEETFPNTGGTRSEKFIKYLPSFGWEPIVLTRKRSKEETPFYKELSQEFSAAKIYETGQARTFSVLQKVGLGRFSIRLNKIFFFPDIRVDWVPFAILKGLAIFKREEIDLIYTTSPSESAHLIGWVLSKITGRPWVADFRDLWLHLRRDVPSRKPPTRLHSALAMRLEAKFLLHADHIIANTDAHQSIMKAQFKLNDKKITTIPNGYDEEDFLPHVNPSKEDKNLVLGFLGSFEGSAYMNTPKDFFYALAKINREAQPQVKLLVWGLEPSPNLKEELRTIGILNAIDFRGFLPHHDALNALQNVHVLLVMGGTSEHWRSLVPQKLYQYIYMKKPILALVPLDSQSSNLIKSTHTGWVVPPDDREAIVRKIEDIHQLWKTGDLSTNPDEAEVAGYARRALTGQLASVFDSLTNLSHLKA